MAGRIRTIKPEILDDERTARLSHAAWRLFVSLIVLADDYGNFRAAPEYLHGVVFWGQPADDERTGTVGGIDALLVELARPEVDGSPGLVTLYRVRGQQYGHLEGWSKNQRVSHPGSPRVPKPSEGENVGVVANSGESPEKLHKSSGESPELSGGSPSGSPISDHRSPRDDRGARKRASRLDPDWSPSTATVEALRTELRVEPLAALSSFRDYWLSASGSRATKHDWDATFRNWVRKDADRLPVYEPPAAKPAPVERAPAPAEALAAIAELERKATQAALPLLDVSETAARSADVRLSGPIGTSDVGPDAGRGKTEPRATGADELRRRSG